MREVIRRSVRVKTYPVFWRLVVWIADTVVLRLQFVNPFGLAFKRHHLKIIEVKEAEHVPAHIKHEHTISVLEFHKRQFLFHVFT